MFSGKVDSTAFSNLKQRLIKLLSFSNNDVRNYLEAGPYGLDSNPVKNMVAIYGLTGTGAQGAIIGYINKNQLADVGEMRIYSTDSSGNLQGQIWLKNNGTAQTTQNCSPAVLGDKNKTALTDAYNALLQLQVFANACMASTTDPTLVTAATALNTFLTSNLPIFQNDIIATESKNVALN